ncbi:hypothetical protein TetV_385 [Tetraselmis virus 1]|uniref:Uncharacterized protein n=1 Tax=Tetraselmis virus 1 TaxID=2060617 RepID=A0A2P0VNJ7_9VIRU|nr:hypothetical protein QJ968_gp385 [Tetraselmis virus 1]AUF82477.1 hypothetical protein TetV_385 [Tetraselmis virus 1]
MLDNELYTMNPNELTTRVFVGDLKAILGSIVHVPSEMVAEDYIKIDAKHISNNRMSVTFLPCEHGRYIIKPNVITVKITTMIKMVHLSNKRRELMKENYDFPSCFTSSRRVFKYH